MQLSFKISKLKRKDPRLSVLFVCLGNICRSPMAEGVFRGVAERAGLSMRVRADSAGIGDWHIGQPPDPRAVNAAKRRGYDLSAIRGRQVEVADFSRFGWILAMDESNLKALEEMKPAEFEGRLGLLLDYAPQLGLREIPDPYYGGPEGFDRVLDLVEPATNGLIAEIRTALAQR
jgi:protein-tyrosine phosphatase